MTLTLDKLNRIETTEENSVEVDREVENLFGYHPWTDEQKDAGKPVCEALAEAYKAILAHVPSSPTRTRALNAITDARMLANQAITFNGQV